MTRLASAAIAVLLVAQLRLVFFRSYDVDEFEHVHTGYCVANGLVPYRDFFEHHGPLPQYLSALLINAIGPVPLVLPVHRLLSLFFMVLTLTGTYCMSRLVLGRWTGLPAVVWLLTFHWFIDKSLEWRPDVPAMCFITWSTYAAVRAGRGEIRWGFAAGFLLALASLCTQKVVFLAAGMVLGTAVTAAANRVLSGRLISITAVGLVIPWAAFALLALLQNGIGQALRCMILWPLNWQTEVFYFGHLTGPIGGAPAHLVLGLLGLIMCAFRALRDRARRRGETALVTACLCHLLGLVLLPAVYLQFYMLALPFFAALSMSVVSPIGSAARPGLGRQTNRRGRGTIPLFLCMTFFAADAMLWLNSSRVVAFESFDKTALGIAAIGLALWPFQKRLAIAICWIALLVPSLGRIVALHVRYPSTRQVSTISLIGRLVPDDQTVLDGFSGLGCLRPHAFYWWWINDHTLPMIASEAMLAPLRQLVAEGKPALIIYDQELQKLHSILAPDIARSYRPIERQPGAGSFVLLLRNDLRDRSAK